MNDFSGLFFFIYSLTIVLSRPFTGRWFDSKGADVVMYPALLCFAGGLCIVSQASQGFVILLSAVFMGFGFGTFSPVCQALAIRSLPKERIGLATSTFLAIAEVGTGIGPFFIGALIPLTGFRQMYIIMACIVILSIILYYFMYSKSEFH
jgi:MFS family permease